MKTRTIGFRSIRFPILHPEDARHTFTEKEAYALILKVILDTRRDEFKLPPGVLNEQDLIAYRDAIKDDDYRLYYLNGLFETLEYDFKRGFEKPTFEEVELPKNISSWTEFSFDDIYVETLEYVQEVLSDYKKRSTG